MAVDEEEVGWVGCNGAVLLDEDVGGVAVDDEAMSVIVCAGWGGGEEGIKWGTRDDQWMVDDVQNFAVCML